MVPKIDLNHKLGLVEKDPNVNKETSQRLLTNYTGYPLRSKRNKLIHARAQGGTLVIYIISTPLFEGIPGKYIIFKRNNWLLIEAYSDADHAGLLIGKSSTTGY